MKPLVVLTALCTAFVTSAAAAELTVYQSNTYCSSNGIRVEGAIKKGDSLKFARLAGQVMRYVKARFGDCMIPPDVVLNSPGGEVAESLAIGETIRAQRLRTHVYRGRVCLSSCVFLFAAGIDRWAWGEIGIHRPYLMEITPGTSVADIRERRSALLKRVQTFLSNLEVSEQLLDAMLAVPPESMRILTHEEMKQFRMIGEDPSYEEFRVARNAKMFDLSSSEYRARNARAQIVCEEQTTVEFNVCVSAKILRIDMAESQRRWERYQLCRQQTAVEPEKEECFRRFMTHAER